MPNCVQCEELLSYEELLRIARIAVSLGITDFKITGGEPLLRDGCIGFIRDLKSLDSVQRVTLTTNGLLLSNVIDELAEIGIDGINISLDSLIPERRVQINGSGASPLAALRRGLELGIIMKTNTVLLTCNADEITDIAAIAENAPVDVRFIELMPVGTGANIEPVSYAAALSEIQERYPSLHKATVKRGSGPAEYYTSPALRGNIGFIHAISRKFCSDCNRVRLTASGTLKPCLCYREGTPLRKLLRNGASDSEILDIMARTMLMKPECHTFERPETVTEHGSMSCIGG